MIVIQRWPLTVKFECKYVYYIDNGKNGFGIFKSNYSSNPVTTLLFIKGKTNKTEIYSHIKFSNNIVLKY